MSLLDSKLRLPGLRKRGENVFRPKPGASPGIDRLSDLDTPPPAGTFTIHCLDYGPKRTREAEFIEFDDYLADSRPEWSNVRWINIDGLHPHIINRFKDLFLFHTLAAEDVLNVTQRPKIEPYDDHFFIVIRMLMLVNDQLSNEQVSMFFYSDTLITFQERKGDVWEPIRKRINNENSRLRNNDASYLLYALLDAVVDHSFPILERYNDILEEIESNIMLNPKPRIQQRIHAIKRELSILRRVVWPLRDMINALYRDEHMFFSDTIKTYLRDVYDHAVQVIDIIETHREMTGGLNDLYMSAVSNRMNETMKVLTLMASFFIPITFLAGVYGMNFEHIPELSWQYSYLTFWSICLIITAVLAIFFIRKGWIGKSLPPE